MNGQVQQQSLQYQSTASYTCHEGYLLVGGSERMCLDSGVWSGEEPDCDRELTDLTHTAHTLTRTHTHLLTITMHEKYDSPSCTTHFHTHTTHAHTSSLARIYTPAKLTNSLTSFLYSYKHKHKHTHTNSPTLTFYTNLITTHLSYPNTHSCGLRTTTSSSQWRSNDRQHCSWSPGHLLLCGVWLSPHWRQQ